VITLIHYAGKWRTSPDWTTEIEQNALRLLTSVNALEAEMARGGIPFPAKDPVLYFMQRLRDEAHRFAIGFHRKKRQMELGRSELDEIHGIGASRKRALLHHFGSVRGIKQAGLKDLEMVKGVSKSLAKKIYNHFHSGT
jgi:excinuclease UvrABC nuclease subunit